MLQTENTNSRKKLNDEIQNLKEEMSNLEELLATEIGKSMELYEKLSFEQKKVNSLSQAAEMHEKVLAEKEEAIEQLSKRVSVYEQNNVQF